MSEQGAFSHTSVDSVSPESCWKLPPCCILTTFLLNLSLSSGSTWNLCKQFTHKPFYGPFSGTTWVSRCQKRTSGLYGARGD